MAALALIRLHLLFEQLFPKEVNHGQGGHIKMSGPGGKQGRGVWL